MPLTTSARPLCRAEPYALPRAARVARADEHARVEAAHGEEIAMVVRWAEAVAGHVGVPLRLGAPLLS